MNEKEYTFSFIFNYLKNEFSFSPRNFMADFAMGQINAIKSIFPECKIHSCFFHFSQAVWKNFKKYILKRIVNYYSIYNYYAL